MRISKEKAREVASKLANDAFKAKKERIKKESEELGDKLIKKYIPSELLEICNKYSEYFNTRNYLYVKDKEKEDERRYNDSICIETTFNNPTLSGSWNGIPVSTEDYKEVKKKNTEYSNCIGLCDKYERDIANALIALGTTKRIKEKFPEAIKYISEEETANLPSCNYDSLRMWIQNPLK
jgi:hypothetical protein